MYRARVLTCWQEIDGRYEMHPATLGIDCSVADVTAQPAAEIPPEPNLVVVEIRAAAEALDQIAADSDVTELWREEIDDDQT